jgi:O-methyltransferase
MNDLYRMTREGAGRLAALPSLLVFLLDADVGREYGVGPAKKLRLIVRFARNARLVHTLSRVREHVELAGAILRIPRQVEGDIVECGCYLGGSSVNLSHACALAGRRLVICDSFEGLPEPSAYDRAHINLHSGLTDEYYKGRFAAPIEIVKGNIDRYGKPQVCDFVVGFFDETLAQLDRDVAMAFLDVDLIDSLRPCLIALWPKLGDGCRIYVHEARSLSLVSIFFATDWWQRRIGEAAPGFVGAGTGLPLTAVTGSELGYAQKGAHISSSADQP